MPSKFGVSRSDYNEFICKINDIIWDDELEAVEFDSIWEQIIQDHGVGINDWFADTYAIRGQWVMAHCRDLRMAPIMRTTQRSESENSFFKRFEHKSGTLVEFWMRFESAMDQQRHTQKQLDNMDKHSSATASTHLTLEIHAAKVYTYSAFQKFKQEAIFSIDTCRTGGFTERGELEEQKHMQVIDEKQIAMSIMWSEVHEAVGLLRDKGIADVDSFSAVVTILPPKNSKNKGTGKRLVSAKTKAMVLARKPKHKCKNCKRMTNHDKRNCPNPFSAHAPLCEGSSEPEEDEGEERKSWIQNKNRRQISDQCCSIYFECVT
ncbi:uncharacterized protein LOC141628979 [Silene latifolia]|uniref:uncharacterized protein LOC141628979 n=1 Tax=Silene latifolia TaxID=37657 RepID=UPI003D76DCBF